MRKAFWIMALLLVALVAPPGLRADTQTFDGFYANGQGALSFTPGLGDTVTVGAGSGGNGALITEFLNTGGFCGGDCSIVGGFLTLTTGGETSGSSGGGIFSYTFGAGGTLEINGEIPLLGINAPTVLLTASFLSGTTFSGAGTTGSILGQLDPASITLNPALGTYTYTGGTSEDLSFSIDPACSTTGGLCSGSIVQSTNSLQTITAPEPGSFSLILSGLLGLGLLTGLKRHLGKGLATEA